MIRHKYIEKISIAALVLAVLLTMALLWGGNSEFSKFGAVPAYQQRIFDKGRVHTLDILAENWVEFLENAPKEEYISCTLEIDGETFHNVGLRTKGNNSLRLTGEYELYRYSLKIEFDHFSDQGNYYGLDKFSLDASFQDNSYLKTYMVYDMMRFMEVPTPLCSYVWVTVNGEAWGLFLAVEEPEEAFARRNFGRNHGQLYKPDYTSLKAENADVALRYIDDEPSSYPNIFHNAKFHVSNKEKQRLIEALEILSTGKNLEEAVNIEQVLRYFAVQVFVMNWDSYLGHTGHNYFLYEKDGKIQMLPWDYNLAFGTYALGMTNPVKNPQVLINYPVLTPAPGEVMQKRPLYHNVMKNQEYFSQYQEYLKWFLEEYMDSARFETELEKTAAMISPFVEKDPTAFCSYEDHNLAVKTLKEICMLRSESVKQQLKGQIPATLREQQEYPEKKLQVQGIDVADLGDFQDLETAKERQEKALKNCLMPCTI